MNHQTGFERHVEEQSRRRWGGLRTWVYIGILVIGLLGSIVITYFLVERGVQKEWNLGYPPTAPSLLIPRLL